MFIAALLRIAKIWNQSRCQHPIKEMWYIYAMQYYSATKKNEIVSFAGKRMET
jgi:hypothetical protein